jgi:L-2-hydroxycarboxylate dehydrogenase (NAD+)
VGCTLLYIHIYSYIYINISTPTPTHAHTGDELGGYKGYSWATVVELLSIAFQSGEYGSAISGVNPETGKPQPMRLGHFFLAIDVSAICEEAVFRKNAGEFLRYMRGSKKDPTGPGKIWTAGEPEFEARTNRTSMGGVMVPPILLADMKGLRETLPGIKEKYPVFCFEE